jgi:chaperonin cofactor prefoldin
VDERISAEYVRELLDRLRRLERRVEQLEGQLADRDRRIAELEQQLEEAVVGPSGRRLCFRALLESEWVKTGW